MALGRVQPPQDNIVRPPNILSASIWHPLRHQKYCYVESIHAHLVRCGHLYNPCTHVHVAVCMAKASTLKLSIGAIVLLLLLRYNRRGISFHCPSACLGEFLCWDGEVDKICRDGYVRDPDWGDDNGGGDDFFDSDVACLQEAVACSMSFECTECAAILDDSSETTASEGDCPPYNNTGCEDFADAMCCLYGSPPTCREDEELNEYIGEGARAYVADFVVVVVVVVVVVAAAMAAAPVTVS